MPITRKRRAMTGFIRVPFFKRKAVVIVCFKTRRDGFLSVQFLVSGRESVFNSRHHNRMANHHRAMQSC